MCFPFRYSKGAGTLVTLLQFLFISSIGFIFTAKLGSKKPDVPVLEYMKIVLLFFGSSLSANAALAYNISMPLQMIFKSGEITHEIPIFYCSPTLIRTSQSQFVLDPQQFWPKLVSCLFSLAIFENSVPPSLVFCEPHHFLFCGYDKLLIVHVKGHRYKFLQT